MRHLKATINTYALMFLSFYAIDLFLRFFTREIFSVMPEESVARPNLVSVVLCVLIVVIIAGLGKARRSAYIIAYIIFLSYAFCQLIYYKIFGKFFWFKDLLLAKAGLPYFKFALEQVDFSAVIMVLVCIGLMVLTLLYFPKKIENRKKWAIILAVAIVATYFSPWILGTTRRNFRAWRKARIVYEDFNNQNIAMHALGYYMYTARDIYLSFARKFDYEAAYKYLDDYFASNPAHAPNAYTGILKGKNVIIVMMESMDELAISDKFTPNIRHMMKNGMNFTEFYAPYTTAGGTINTEFTALSGYHTAQHGSPLPSMQNHAFPYALPWLMSQAGYATNYVHFNAGSYYNRANLFKTLGFESLYFMEDNGVSREIGSFDSKILGVDDVYKNFVGIDQKPFFTFFTTYSGHLDYNLENDRCYDNAGKFPDIDIKGNEDYYCLRIQLNDTDSFFGELLDKLESDGLLENTVIVAFADHYAFAYHDFEPGERNSYRVPFFIYGNGVPAMVIDKAAAPSDIPSTLLNMLGIEIPKYYLGHDILSPAHNGAIYFNNTDWYDGKTIYTQSNPANGDAATIFDGLTKRRQANDLVLESDYFGDKE